jgi:hypothetical protein
MEILAVQAIGELVGDGLADEIGAGSQKGRPPRRSRAAGGWLASQSGLPQPVTWRDVVDVLGGEAKPPQRPLGRAGQQDLVMGNEAV